MLLVAAGLLIRTLSQLRAVDPGIDPRNVVTMAVILPESKYAKAEQYVHFFDETLRRVRALPGVEAVSGIDTLPLSGGGSTQPVAIAGEPVRPLSEQPEVAVRDVLPGYAATLGMRVVDGRDFTDADRDGRPLAVVVSAATARRFWPNQRAVGKRLTLGLISNDVREVVGVVSDVRLNGLNVSDAQTIYVPVTQVPTPAISFAVRSALPPQQIAQSIVGAIHGVDAEQPVVDIATMDEVIGESIAQQRFAMRLLTAFAALALLLAAIGIYGVLSYTVRQRVQEIGIRMALGASARKLQAHIILQTLSLAGIGLIIGLGGSLIMARSLAALLFGVNAYDPASFIGTVIVLVAVATIAGYFPARRASQIDPINALRAN